MIHYVKRAACRIDAKTVFLNFELVIFYLVIGPGCYAMFINIMHKLLTGDTTKVLIASNIFSRPFTIEFCIL